jgi:hypothetical protein
LLRGRPSIQVKATAQLVQTGFFQPFVDRMAVFDALYADGDTVAASRAAARLAPIVAAATSANTEPRAGQYASSCWLEQWRLAHGDTRTVSQAIRRLRAAAEPKDSFATVGESHLCAMTLDAWSATLSGRADAQVARLALDSAMRTGPPYWSGYQLGTSANHVLGRLFAAAGDTVRALAAVRRFTRQWGIDVLIATRSRLEGRFAAAVGDTAAAIQAYRTYLTLRANPEPVLVPQRDSVRSELQELLHGRVPHEGSP